MNAGYYSPYLWTKGQQIKAGTDLVQTTPTQMALKLLECMFTKEVIANSTPTSNDEKRIKTVQKLDPAIMKFIEGINTLKVCITIIITCVLQRK